jgi:hypothetical protein
MMDEVLITKMLHFIVPGLFGMLYAYMWRWVDKEKTKNLFTYLFGDKRVLTKALLVFVASCAGVLSMDYLNQLDNAHLMLAGIGLGLLIPQKVEAKEEHSA